MMLSLLSYNFHDLSTERSRDRLRDYLQRQTPPMDVLCVQQHSFQDKDKQLLQNDIWREAAFLIAPPPSHCAPVSDVASSSDVGPDAEVIAGQEGLFIAIAPGLQGFLREVGALMSNRRRWIGLWVHLDHPLFGSIGIANIDVGGQCPGEREIVWRDLFNCLDSRLEWIIMGNFNMVEAPEDQRGAKDHGVVQGSEKEAWTSLKQRLHLKDTFVQRPGHLRFTWNSKPGSHRLDDADEIGDSVVRRLDRCYSSLHREPGKFSIQSCIPLWSEMSDLPRDPVLSTLISLGYPSA